MNAFPRVRSFAGELRRRKVYHVALAYVSAGVMIVLGVAELYDVLLLPDWTPRLVLLLLVAGLPVALVLAWAYEIRPDDGPPVASAPVAASAAMVPTPAGPAAVAAPERAVAAGPAGGSDTRPGIVVLPFDNFSPDPADAYFSTGLTEEVTADLAGVSGLRVLSRTSATQLKASGREVRSFARELGVRYLMEGSVRKAGDRVRVTAQLIDAVGDEHVWAKKYDGTFSEVFEIQESVARAVVEALRVELSAGEERALSAVPVSDVRAYERYLRARDQIQRYTVPALDKAVAYLEQVRDEVGETPAILSGLAYAHAQYVNLGHAQDEALDRAEDLARRAVRLDPRSAEALYVLGFIALWFRADMAGALRYLEEAVEARSDEPQALFMLTMTYAHLGRIQEARKTAARLIALDPLDPVHRALPGGIELLAGRFEEALGLMERAIENDDENPAVQFSYAATLFFAGRHEELARFVAATADPARASSLDAVMLLMALACDGDVAGMLEILAQAETHQTFRRDPQLSWLAASSLAFAGEREAALDWIGNAVDRGFLNAPYLSQHDPFLAPLRADPLFQAVVERARAGAERVARASARTAELTGHGDRDAGRRADASVD